MHLILQRELFHFICFGCYPFVSETAQALQLLALKHDEKLKLLGPRQ
jgi:hypothetical protein